LIGEGWSATFGDEREEESSAWTECSDVIGHGSSFGQTVGEYARPNH
jgi:hypothetical protein